jgi:hypothetical protein
MEESSQNENKMNNNQIVENINANEREEKMKEILKKLHLHIRNWRHYNRNALCWSFYCINGNKLMDVKWF